MLERVRGQVVQQPSKASELTQFEVKALTQRTGSGGAVDDMRPSSDLQENELLAKVDKLSGIGFEKQNMVSSSEKAAQMTKSDLKQLN